MSFHTITRDVLLRIHRDLLEDHGGSAGIRDPGLLDSALAMPLASFGGELLHRDLFEMAAAYLFHLVKNRPFIDGNKRVGLAAALTFLEANGCSCTADHDSLGDITLRTAEGRVGKSELADFFRDHSQPLGGTKKDLPPTSEDSRGAS